MKRRFNNGNQEDREEISKEIMSTTIKTLTQTDDLSGLIHLLEIEDLRIQMCILNAIEDCQLQTNVYPRLHKQAELLKAGKDLIELLRKRSRHHFAMVNFVPVTTDIIATLHLALCAGGTTRSNIILEVQNFAENSLLVVGKVINDSRDSTKGPSECGDLLVPLKQLLEDLRNVGKNPSLLPVGNIRDVIMDDINKVHLRKKFSKSMTYLEKYCFLFVLINQVRNLS